MTKPSTEQPVASAGGRLRAFFRLSRPPRETFHRHEAPSGARRLIEFLRIDRGRRV